MQRVKKILGIKLLDIWFDEKLFINSAWPIRCLHTNQELDKNVYDFKETGKTFLLDISRQENEIFSSFESKSCRYPINKAKRDGIHVWKAESESDKKRYLDFENKFAEKKGIPAVNKEELDALEIYVAETPVREFLGGCAFLTSSDQKTVRYKYGATSHKFNANEAILWQAICDYHARGFVCFDFGGCKVTDDKESFYYKNFQFKKKFGGELSDSYRYYRIKGIYKGMYYFANLFIKIFFKGNLNEFIVWLNRKIH
ncbi:hypothetical protein C804_06317 [Lachnospiraceae bacterium A4]|nr:hypothetical protein C804_06317 [Lachnospiraceae bacterium A4]